MKKESRYFIVLSALAIGLIVCGSVMLRGEYCDGGCVVPVGVYPIVGGILLHLWLCRRVFFPSLEPKNYGEERIENPSQGQGSERSDSEYNEMVAELDRRLEKIKASEQMFSSVIEAAPTGMLIINAVGEIVLVNHVIESLFGWSKEELIGQKVEILVPDGVRAGHPKLREGFVKEGRARAMGIGREVHGQRRDGGLFTAELGLKPFQTSNGVFVVASVVDVTSRLEGERLLFESEERLSLALSGSGEGLWDWEIAKGTFFWSSEYIDLLGVDRLLLKPETDLFEQRLHPEDRVEVLAVREKNMATGGLFNVDCRLRKEDGNHVWINVRGRTYRDAFGKPIRMSGTVRDISARKSAENELTASMTELSHANKELRNFAYITSHDLREPLRAIASFVQLLKADYGEQLDESANEYMDFAIKGAKRLQSMILSLMTYSKVDAEEKVFKQLSLSEPISIAASELTLAVEETSAVLDIESGFPMVKGNSMQLTQLFQNLIANAIKFHRENAPVIRISYENGKGSKFAALLSPDRSYCVVRVEDNGIGVAPEYQEKIFSMFQRLHTAGEFEGNGIGLALCSKIATRHKGLIWIESEEGKGSVFHVALPLLD